MPGNDDVMTWFPRREDYEIAPAFQPDETIEEKIERLNETIEVNQTSIKEVVDGTSVPLEQKIYRTMDTNMDVSDMQKLLKECEEKNKSEEGEKYNAEIKKAKIGIMNLKAYLSQVDCLEFASAIRDEAQFKVGCEQIFTPWLEWAESQLASDIRVRPLSFSHGVELEGAACRFLKRIVKANPVLKKVQAACEGIRANPEAHVTMARLQERYYVLCKRAEQRVKQLQHLLTEWKRLDDLMDPQEPKDWDDYIPKQMIVFLKTYAMVFP